MIEAIIGFYSKSPPADSRNISDDNVARELRRRKWDVFFTITFGYGFYYVCRLSFNVAKKTMADEGVLNASEMGVIGSSLFFAYAFGKLVNGILADRINVRKFMVTGLLISALVNLCIGFTAVFWLFIILWGINGWFQSFGAPSSVVTLSHRFSDRERGSFYGMWSSSHNIGEAITFIGTAVAGIVGTFFSGIFSDKLFGGRRNMPVLIFGILYVIAIALFLLGPADPVVDTLSMMLFGLAVCCWFIWAGLWRLISVPEMHRARRWESSALPVTSVQRFRISAAEC